MGITPRGLRYPQGRNLDGGAYAEVYYEYDSMYRLSKAETWDGETVEYSYDEVGNITEARYMSGGTSQEIQTYVYYGATHASHPKMNRLWKIEYDMDGNGSMGNTVDYTTSFDFDANGNMIEKMVTESDGSTDGWYYSYDEDDRLIKVEDGGTTAAEYAYDPFGRRVLKKAGGDTEVYFYDREDVLQEFDGSTVSMRHVHGPGIDDPIAVIIPGGTPAGSYFYNTDGLGSISDLTTQAGATVSARYEYAPFGEASVLDRKSVV